MSTITSGYPAPQPAQCRVLCGSGDFRRQGNGAKAISIYWAPSNEDRVVDQSAQRAAAVSLDLQHGNRSLVDYPEGDRRCTDSQIGIVQRRDCKLWHVWLSADSSADTIRPQRASIARICRKRALPASLSRAAIAGSPATSACRRSSCASSPMKRDGWRCRPFSRALAARGRTTGAGFSARV